MWTVVCDPVHDMLAGGQNRSALVIMLTDGTDRIEALRVGLIRRNTKNKDVEFADQLQVELDKVHECATTINELEEHLEELRREAVEHARMRVQEILGRQSTVPQ